MKKLLYILGGLVVLVVLLNFIVPKEYNVFRSVEINKPKAEVFVHVKYMEKQHQWSPWAKKDPNMERKLTGTDGVVGAVSYWKGNDEVGEGEQEITKIIEGERVEGELRFFKPWESTSDCYFDVEEVASGKTKVTWGFSGVHEFPTHIMMLFMDMDKSVGKDFQAGLNDLKKQLE